MLAAWSYVDCMMVLKSAEHRAAAYKFIDSSLATKSQKLTTQHSMAFPVNDEAISAIAPELHYSSSAEVLKKAPLVPGVTVEEGGSRGAVPGMGQGLGGIQGLVTSAGSG